MDIADSRTLYSVFSNRAAQDPSKLWISYQRADGEEFHWTYSEFLDSVHQAAHLLSSFNVGLNDVFTLHLANHPAYPQLILAASYLGATAMPSNPASSVDELAYLIKHAESKLIFTENGGLEAANAVAANAQVDQVVLCRTGDSLDEGSVIYESLLDQQPTEPPPGRGAADRIVQLLYTSGTTAKPKGVILTNANFVFAAEVFRGSTGLRSDDRHLITLPLFHGAAQIHALWPSMITGASVAIMARFSASRFFAQAIQFEATLAALFGAPIRMLLKQPDRPADAAHTLRNITFAQSLTDAQYEEWNSRFGVPLQQLWGMTETCSLPVMSPLTGDRNLRAMGRPVVGYDLKVVDEVDNEVEPGQPGQLIVRGVPGRTFMAGYLKDEVATAETLRGRSDGAWLYTGDTVYYDDEAFLYFLDRGTDLIKRAGENISSVEIETVMIDFPGVLDVCVVGLPDEVRDERVVALVVPESGEEPAAEAIQSLCHERLAAFKVPEEILFVESLPRTSVGKIQKEEVRVWLQSGEADVISDSGKLRITQKH